jgi:fumarate hydratase subunit beta
MEKHITVPFSAKEAAFLTAGDLVYLTGTVYTARDAAHKRMMDTLAAGKPLPIDIEGSVIYYMGPSPAREGRVIGSAGPTTSSRMDKYTPTLLDLGLAGMIGKGKRSPQVKESMIQNGAVYFAAVGGAGALLSHSVIASQPVAYEDLGTEAIRKLYIKDFPAIVVIDSLGHDLYESNPQQYQKEVIL